MTSRRGNAKAEQYKSLSGEEKQMLSPLLVRGFANGQIAEVVLSVKSGLSAAEMKRILGLTKDWCEEVWPTSSPPTASSGGYGGMSDAAKRLRQDGEPSSSDRDGFELVPQVETERGGSCTASSMRHMVSCINAAGKVVVPARPANGMELPSGIDSLGQWSRTVYNAPKFKKENYSYVEMVQKAMTDPDVLSYIAWVQSRFQGEKPVAGKCSDFAAYLEAIGFRASDFVGVRVFKDP